MHQQTQWYPYPPRIPPYTELMPEGISRSGIVFAGHRTAYLASPPRPLRSWPSVLAAPDSAYSSSACFVCDLRVDFECVVSTPEGPDPGPASWRQVWSSMGQNVGLLPRACLILRPPRGSVACCLLSVAAEMIGCTMHCRAPGRIVGQSFISLVRGIEHSLM